MRFRMDQVANYMRATERRSFKTAPPAAVVQNVLAMGSWPFPALEGVVEVPVMRPDGTVLDRPGYDPTTKLFYLPAAGLRLPPIPGRPTQSDAREALRVLKGVFSDFPFDDDASRANTLALLLTPVLRPLTKGRTPLAVIGAPQQGTGKSLLAQVIAIISTGSTKAMNSMPETEEEMAKTILALLRGGSAMVIFDNVDRKVDSGQLALALTAEEFEARLLGTNEQGRYPQNATWILTGNNVRLGGDIRRRCFSIRLDAKLSKPYERPRFAHPNLVQYVIENRGSLIGALLTVARAWIIAGRPRTEVRPFGSFEQWADITGSILAYAGVRGFLGNSEQFDEADDDGPEWEVFFRALREEFGDSEFTTHEVAERSRINRALIEALPDNLADEINRPNASFQKKLGQAFKKKQSARFGAEALYVKVVRKDRTGSKVWAVRKGAAE